MLVLCWEKVLLFICLPNFKITAFATTTTTVPTTNTTPSRSVVFMCGATPCPAGQDCISVNVSLHCADPCEQYSVLDDAWRSTGYGRADNCDARRSWQGWYRMLLDGNSTQMPETCVEVSRCGTQVPLWLSSPHPLLGEGVVEGDVCGHHKYWNYSPSRWYDNCCYRRLKIHVKSCPENYYVYRFVRPNVCYSAYCAGM